MKVIPILDYVGVPLLAAAFVALVLLERRWPLRRRVDRWLRRLGVNFLLAAPSFVILRLMTIPLVVSVAAWAEANGLGVLHLIDLPPVAAGIMAILLLDYTMYVWHWLNHRVPFLWRFHRVHHTDLDLDVSTAFRFHFGEILFSVAVRSAQVIVVGASPIAALIYEIVLESSTEFHHSNLRLPLKFERVLSWFIMTPRVHGIHHSVVTRETNSNYSNFLLVWDRLHGTVRQNVRQEDIVVGVPEYRDPRELSFVSLLVMPFRRQRLQRADAGPDRSGRPREPQP